MVHLGSPFLLEQKKITEKASKTVSKLAVTLRKYTYMYGVVGLQI